MLKYKINEVIFCRPKKLSRLRLSALRKDYIKKGTPGFRRDRCVLGNYTASKNLKSETPQKVEKKIVSKKPIKKRKIIDFDKYLKDAEYLGFDPDEILNMTVDDTTTNATKNGLFVNRKRKRLHPSIDVNNVKEVYNPKGDGLCGFRVMAYLRYESLIKDSLGEIFDTPLWFDTPYCAQVLADAYSVPICVYNADDATATLPLKNPVKPKLRVQPYHLQNINRNHWLAIKLGRLKTMYLMVEQLYFKIDESYATLFKTTWNLFGQFPKYKEESLPFNPKTDKLITIPASDED
ncbi:hypothetical protein EDC94DRAFT_657723 [Helicostylum pulchrum]|nr:hypothetical protein EDC94DRAFT_657723 [Helicostylum pulchrum]